MYRRLLCSMMPKASGSAIRLGHGRLNTDVSSRFSLALRCAVRRKSTMTYSRWHCLRTAIKAANWPIREPACCHPYSTSLSSNEKTAESVNEVIERYYSLIERGRMEPDSILDFSTSLFSAVQISLEHLPWLQCRHDKISYSQILMNGKTEELLTEPLYSSRHFQAVCDYIKHNVSQIPEQDVVFVFLTLIRSGLKKTDTLAVALLGRCYDAVPQMDSEQLTCATYLWQRLGSRDFRFSERILSRLNELVDISSSSSTDVDVDFKNLCNASLDLTGNMSHRLINKCASVVLLKATEQFPNIDLAALKIFLRYTHKMGYHCDSEIHSKLQSLALSMLDVFDDYDELQHHHIQDICDSAKRQGVYQGKIVDRMQARALQLLRGTSDSPHVREITNLLFAFPSDTPQDLKQEFTELLKTHMKDADMLIVANVSVILRNLHLDLEDPELMALFQQKILQHIDHIAVYITQLVRVLWFLNIRQGVYDAAFNHQVCEAMLRVLNTYQAYSPNYIVTVVKFLLCNTRTIIPSILMQHLLSIIPRCNLPVILVILNALDNIRSHRSRFLHNQVLEIQFYIQQNIGRQVENAIDARQLALLIKGTYLNCQKKDFALLRRIMEHYPRLTKDLTLNSYLKTTEVFMRMNTPYYHPEVFEDLIRFAMDNYQQLRVSGVVHLFHALAMAGYQPRDFDRFSQFALQVLDEAMKHHKHRKQIYLTYYLSLMHIFPDHVLGEIFTFDYLQEVDSIVKDIDTVVKGEKKGEEVQGMMMELNRSVILESPHLDVPWFHEDYCQQQSVALEGKDFLMNSFFAQEATDVMEEVVGGWQNLKHQVYSPYYHPIDFEVILDGKGEPVSNAVWKKLGADKPGYQRVAVKLMGNRQLCINFHRRRGTYLRDRRELEILGYRVEEINRYDWNSMALSDWESKVDFVRNKVFQTTSKEPTETTQGPPTMHPYWK